MAKRAIDHWTFLVVVWSGSLDSLLIEVHYCAGNSVGGTMFSLIGGFIESNSELTDRFTPGVTSRSAAVETEQGKEQTGEHGQTAGKKQLYLDTCDLNGIQIRRGPQRETALSAMQICAEKAKGKARRNKKENTGTACLHATERLHLANEHR